MSENDQDREDKAEDVLESTSNKEPSSTKSSKGTFAIIIITILIIALGSIAYILLSNNKLFNKTTTIKKDSKQTYSKYTMTGNDLGAFDLSFLQLENNGKNVVYSPLSIKYALEMLSAGAKGETKTQIDTLIGKYAAKKYTNSSNMSFANAMFINNTYKDSIKASYTKTLQNDYNAEVIYDSFATPDTINNWVSNKTFNLINNLMDDVSNNNFVLVNALAIDMNWNHLIQATTDPSSSDNVYEVSYDHENYNAGIRPIESDQYESLKFNNSAINAKAVEVGATINNYDIVKTLGEDNIRATITKEYKEYLASDQSSSSDEQNVTTYVDKFIKELNSNYKQYKESTDFSLYVDDNVKVFAKDLKEYNGTTLQYVGIMPQKVALSAYLKTTDATSISKLIGKLKTIKPENFTEGKVTKVTGLIPLFKYDYELKLTEDLKALGVTDIFDINKADLSNLTSKGEIINKTVHKANIEFSNEGIKAAAATAMGGFGSTAGGFEHLYDVPVEVIDITFDKPYLYLIRDKATGEVWFTGTVYEPIAQ
jgi:serine protease inhibitor